MVAHVVRVEEEGVSVRVVVTGADSEEKARICAHCRVYGLAAWDPNVTPLDAIRRNTGIEEVLPLVRAGT